MTGLPTSASADLMIRKLLLIFIVLAAASAALGEDQAKRPARQFLLELSPLLSPAESSLPGPTGLGLGGEVSAYGNWNIGGMLTYSRVQRNETDIQRIQGTDSNPDPIVARGHSTAAFATTRYYAHPFAPSWFAGGGLGLSMGESDYISGSNRFTDDFAGGFLTCELGYRWIWQNGLSFRLTGLGHSDPLTKHDIDPTTTGAINAQGPSARRREVTDVVPEVHMGIGYSF